MSTEREARTGSLQVIEGRCVLRYERRLAHPVEKVWRAITDPEQLKHWYPVERELEHAVGGAAREGDFAAGVVAHGRVTAYEPPRLLEYTLSTESIPLAGFGDERTSRFELSPDPMGCLLVFVHSFGDRPGAAGYASGWQACLDALEAVVAGRPVEEFTGWTERHEDYVERFGLDEGTVRASAGGWVVRFERQLMGHPVDKVWALLTGTGETAGPAEAGGQGGTAPAAAPAVGEPPPPRFTNGYVPAAAITTVEPPSLLEYRWRAAATGDAAADADAAGAGGLVRWTMSEGPGGARVVLTQTVPADLPGHRAVALAAWHTQLELLAGHLGGEGRCWPRERTDELRRHYADRLD